MIKKLKEGEVLQVDCPLERCIIAIVAEDSLEAILVITARSERFIFTFYTHLKESTFQRECERLLLEMLRESREKCFPLFAKGAHYYILESVGYAQVYSINHR